MAVHVGDMWEALAEGLLPGEFTSGGTRFEFPVVRSCDALGLVRYWALRVEAHKGGVPVAFNCREWLAQPVPQLAEVVGVVTTNTWHDGGRLHAGKHPTLVEAGKNLGKKNATNAVTQALRDALGLFNRQLKGGGTLLAAPPDAAPPERPLPMLVQKPGDSRAATLDEATLRAGVTVQPKLNGVRMVCFRAADGDVVFYSRRGGDYPGLMPLREAAAALLKEDFSVYLDGELYEHGAPLRTISGWARSGIGSPGARYHVFDCFFPRAAEAASSAERQLYLDRLFAAGGAAGRVVRVENHPVKLVEGKPETCIARIEALARRFRRQGYEGAIVRKDGAPYRYGTGGYHSPNLLKLKPLFDSEFPVEGYAQGASGKDRGALIWECSVPGTGEKFTVVPKNMTYAQRYEAFRRLGEEVAPGVTRFARDFRGRLLTVEYPELSTKTGKPTQAKALAFRATEPAPGELTPEDPLAALLLP